MAAEQTKWTYEGRVGGTNRSGQRAAWTHLMGTICDFGCTVTLVLRANGPVASYI